MRSLPFFQLFVILGAYQELYCIIIDCMTNFYSCIMRNATIKTSHNIVIIILCRTFRVIYSRSRHFVYSFTTIQSTERKCVRLDWHKNNKYKSSVWIRINISIYAVPIASIAATYLARRMCSPWILKSMSNKTTINQIERTPNKCIGFQGVTGPPGNGFNCSVCLCRCVLVHVYVPRHYSICMRATHFLGRAVLHLDGQNGP